MKLLLSPPDEIQIAIAYIGPTAIVIRLLPTKKQQKREKKRHRRVCNPLSYSLVYIPSSTHLFYLLSLPSPGRLFKWRHLRTTQPPPMVHYLFFLSSLRVILTTRCPTVFCHWIEHKRLQSVLSFFFLTLTIGHKPLYKTFCCSAFLSIFFFKVG